MNESNINSTIELNNTYSSFCDYILLNEIKQLSTTKKSLWSIENKKYTFLIAPWMTKTFIKLVLENYFSTHVKKINTSNLPIKKKYVGKYLGSQAKLKKAIVTFETTSKISLFSDI